MIAVLVVLTCATAAAARNATVGARVHARLERPARASITAHPMIGRAAARVLRGRRERALEIGLPDALDAVSRSLRSGGSLQQAVRDAATAGRGLLGADLRRIARDVDRGMPLVDALDRWAMTRSLPGVQLAATALSIAVETGGASARAVDGVAATLRINLGIAGEVRALSSQARLSALVIALAPIAFALLAMTTDDRTGAFLFGTPFGIVCVVAGVGLDVLGWIWMRRVTTVVA